MSELVFDSPALGVVPVFVNAGAALLPALLAGLASLVALLFRPRELWRACRARPGVAFSMVAGIAITCVGIAWLVRTPKVQRRPAAGERSGVLTGEVRRRIDWSALAVEWIRQEKLAAAGGPAAITTKAEAGDAKITATILGGGPLRNGYLGGPSPVGLVEAWRFPPPGSKAAEELDGAMFFASPAVVGDAVYGGSCLVDAFGNYGALFCLDVESGNLRWITSRLKDAAGEETPLKGIFSSPAISADGKYLVVGQGLHTDDQCELLCLNARTGRLHWRVPTPLHIESSPAIEGDLAVAGAGAIEEGEDHHVKGHAGLVVVVKVSTGEKLWEHAINDPESSPVVAGGIVYIGSGFNGSAVVALRTEPSEQLQRQGLDRLLWRTPTPHPATGAVTVTDDLVIAGCGNGDYVFADPHPDGAVLALDRKTGRARWTVKMPDGVLGKIAVLGSRAIVPVRNGEVVAIDLADSAADRVLWRQRIHGTKAALAGPALTGTHVYAVSQDGRLAVLDARNGRILEQHELNPPGKPGEMGLSVSSPTIARGRVYVGSETGGLRCFVGR